MTFPQQREPSPSLTKRIDAIMNKPTDKHSHVNICSSLPSDETLQIHEKLRAAAVAPAGLFILNRYIVTTNTFLLLIRRTMSTPLFA
mmetsp:Transcript_60880/g.72266  ORF Transcript_60880/g.72266 Transcript_60880/m.72266 type:complete len:87 (-) Transcript_60880:93-353(-)